MIAVLLRVSQSSISSSSARERSPMPNAIATRRGHAEAADDDEDRERQRLLPGRDARLGDRGRAGDGQEQVLGIDPPEDESGAEGLRRPKPSTAVIHFGVGTSSPARSRPRHCLSAARTSRAPRASCRTETQVAGAPGRLRRGRPR